MRSSSGKRCLGTVLIIGLHGVYCCYKCYVVQICEDVPKQLDEEVPGLPGLPSKVLIPRLLNLFSSLHIEAKCLAICVANLLAGANPESLAPSLDRLAAHESSESIHCTVTVLRCCVVLQVAPQRGAAHAVQSFA